MSEYHMSHQWCNEVEVRAGWSHEVLNARTIASLKTGMKIVDGRGADGA